MNIIFTVIVAFLIALGAAYYYGSERPSQSQEKTNEESSQTPQMLALTAVNRSGQGLSEMPKEILSMTQVQELDLSNNNLTGALPAEIRHLSSLEVLNISNNKMTGLPAELGQLSKLRVLNAANNQLTGIPHELGNLQSLEILDLSGNDISAQDLDVIRKNLPQSTQIIL
ncbi:leucine-rich repeat domain-containing protein [Candidatus Kaiserbacteria bacterium]|nr:leucine-rich repeat domain-containing protein [Candidatus Kaiserbacteria bacterium]